VGKGWEGAMVDSGAAADQGLPSLFPWPLETRVPCCQPMVAAGGAAGAEVMAGRVARVATVAPYYFSLLKEPCLPRLRSSTLICPLVTAVPVVRRVLTGAQAREVRRGRRRVAVLPHRPAFLVTKGH
jgi:hypothetical protein